MSKKNSEGLADFNGYYPTLATIVTSKSKGKENAMAVAWHSIVSMNPPAYGISISPKRFTHGLITESGAFAVNFIHGKEAELIAAVGGCSGRNMDKFKEMGIKSTPALVLDVPILKVAYFAVECKVVSKTVFGDHDWFVGRIVATHWSTEAFDEKGLVDFANATPTAYLGSDNYLIIGKGKKTHLDRRACLARSKQRASERRI